MKKRSCIFINFIVAVFLFVSCDLIGLGPEVDLGAPVVKLTSHKDNECVGSSFVLKGTAFDNKAVTKLTIDFEDADIHYQIEPDGQWQKKTSKTEWEFMDDMPEAPYTCTFGKTWEWQVFVDTEDKKESFKDSTYKFLITATDKEGNSDTNSKISCVLKVDENLPVISVLKPSFESSYSNAQTASNSYSLKNANSINHLKNGDFEIKGQQTSANSFKELLIEFDDGTTEPDIVYGNGDKNTTVQGLSEENPFDRTTVYYSKLLKVGEKINEDDEKKLETLRTWTLSVKESDWIEPLTEGKHIIRVVSTTVTNSNAYERKVLGYFVWWPESDEPWISTQQGKDTADEAVDTQIYPSSLIAGQANDDDGISSLSYTIKKQAEDKTFKIYDSLENKPLNLSEEEAKSSQWSVLASVEVGIYELTLNIKDLYGASSSLTKYFNVCDVKAPKINLESPLDASSILQMQDAENLTFKGTITDDGKIKGNVLYIAFINPNIAKEKAVDNKVKYRVVSENAWEKALETGYTDEDGNKLYKIVLGEPSFDEAQKLYKYNFNKTFNIFDDLEIGNGKNLSSLYFILRVDDEGISNSILDINISGDSTAPELTFDRIKLVDSKGTKKYPSTGDYFVFAEEDNSPTFPKIETGDKAILQGTWKDDSTDKWGDPSKIGKINLVWNNEEIGEITPSANGTWEATVNRIPSSSGVIKLSIEDFGGIKTTVTKSVFIDSSNAQLERISSDADDGSYGVGKEIKISLEFTKNTTVEGTPYLRLNNGKTAEWDGSTNGKAKHVFTYTVANGDDIGKLGVTSIVGATKWKDASNQTEFSVNIPAEDSKTLSSRNIIIDTVAPKIKGVTAITSAGAYKEGSDILLKLEFSEDVNITNTAGTLNENFKLKFTHNNAVTSSANSTGSNMILYTYKIQEGENTSGLTLDSVEKTANITITDNAGNELTDWSLPLKNLDKAIIVDTLSPTAPVVNSTWGDASVVISEDGTSFTVTNTEPDASVEYTIDGSNWQSYTGPVQIESNGDYTIQARQTDKAGNGPVASGIKTITVDKGELLKRIAASTVNGKYSANTTTNAVEGVIEFRKTVVIPNSATVRLNVKNGSAEYKDVPINNAGSSATRYTFTYNIAEGDNVDKLDVISWSFSTVTLDGKSVAISFPGDQDEKRFKVNRDIEIQTGKPVYRSMELTGKGTGAKLEITYDNDRSITKNSASDAEITLTINEEQFRIPVVLSESEYDDLVALNDDFKNYYKEGVNGAKRNGKVLKNDTTTKYILDYQYDDTNAELKTKFITEGLNSVSVPVKASAVTVNGNKLIVNFGSLYELPVKGADYQINVPAGIVQDDVKNMNEAITAVKTADGLEDPVIRIQKNDQTIIPGATTAAARVTMPAQANIKISCRTPGAEIRWNKEEQESEAKTVKDAKTHTKAELTTKDVELDDAKQLEIYNGEQTLGKADTGYEAATGCKIAIKAQSSKTVNGKALVNTSYEYAVRSVLKFDFATGGYDTDNGYAQVPTCYGEKHMYELQIWIQGGDSSAGSNTIAGFPISWGDGSTYKLMKCGNNDYYDDGSWQGDHTYWYWITWDLSSECYTGFAAGDVPSDAAENGPENWYVGECSWAAKKDNTVLYPGETLILSLDGVDNSDDGNNERGTYFFRSKNHGTR